MTPKNPKRRQELMMAARHLFFTKGYENTSVNDIIKEGGVSKGAFYHHFGAKVDVLEAIIAQMVEQAVSELHQIIVEEQATAIDKWKKVVHLSNIWKIERTTEKVEVRKILRKDENIFLYHKLTNEWFKVGANELAKLVEQGITENVFDVQHIQETASLVLLLLNGLSDFAYELFTDSDRLEYSIEFIQQKFAATQIAIERLLGAQAGSMPIIDEETLHSWFNNQVHSKQ